ncbi:polyamine-transporting ATPase 13A3-like [Diadema setosum]|uniref:polyamine-transporting ATPase 13A3-like n=1 Tax=Diadema setosum TaxID=31175 RepID=UPI003B3B2516
MAHFKKHKNEDLHHQVIEENKGEKIECWGYKKSALQTALVYAAGVLTCGSLFIIVFYWKPDWGLRLTHTRCSLGEADGIVVKDKFQRNHRVWIREQRVKDGKDEQNEGEHVSLTTIRAVTRRHLELDNGSIRYFTFQKVKYLWDPNVQLFFPLRGLAQDVPCSEFHSLHCHGLNEYQTTERRQLYGCNEIFIRVRPILVLLLREVIHPFYIFQLFTVIFWFAINYVYYTLCVIVMSMVSVCVSLYTTRTESVRLRKMAEASSEMVEVLRPGGQSESVKSTQLVPGDVIIIPSNGCSLTCDAVLLAGNCVVNESMLTGESVPVTKTPLPNPSGVRLLYSMDLHKRHTLYCGTEVIQVRKHGDEVVTAVVLQTGFSTAKGRLVKSILYPKPTEIKLYRDALLFVGILFIIAILGVIYTSTMMALAGSSASKTATHAIDIITIAVPPALPAALTIGMVYAQFRLKRQGIFCISPQRINLCGTIDVVCFDKTGTLTEDGLDIQGVHRASDGRFREMVRDAKLLPRGPVPAAMATCHELMQVDGEVMGDPLDIKMFNAIGWSLDLGEKKDTTLEGVLALARNDSWKETSADPSEDVEKEMAEFATLKIYPFSSALQSMGVITAETSTRKPYAFVKGSPEKIRQLSKPDSVPADFEAVLQGYTKLGLRLLALAWKPLNIDPEDIAGITEIQRDAIECDLEFLGFLIMQNKLKPATKPVIQELNEAKIRSIMVTGDNIFTAICVGRECGMIQSGTTVLRIEAKPPSAESKPIITITPLEDEMKEEPDEHTFNSNREDELPIKLNREESRLLVLDGTSFGVICEHYPAMIPKVAAQGIVFARMSPDQKSQLVEELQALQLSVGMCGDGANDCGALKQAHVGIALSQAEASAAAPFTSKTATISCVPIVIKEGRCAMVTSFGLFKYMALYSLVMFATATVLTSVKYYIGDMQFFIFDIVLCTAFVLTVGGNKAHDKISTRRPHTKLVTPPIVFALISQVLVQFAIQIVTLVLVLRQPWYEPHEIDSVHRNVVSYENTAVFFVSNFLYLIFAFVYTPGPPYSNRFYKNIPLLVVFCVQLFILFGFLFASPPKIVKAFQLTVIPSLTFKFVLLGLVVISFMASMSIEYVLAPSTRLMNLITCRLCRKKPPRKYQGVELRVLQKPFMELISDDGAGVNP